MIKSPRSAGVLEADVHLDLPQTIGTGVAHGRHSDSGRSRRQHRVFPLESVASSRALLLLAQSDALRQAAAITSG
jgi:hypothetical protein